MPKWGNIMDITDVRAQNIKKILDTLRFSPPQTKKSIAEQTGLSFSTVSSTCNELRESGLLREGKAPGAAVGRLPGSFAFLRENFAVCCVDLQPEAKIGVAVVDLGNRVLAQEEIDMPVSTRGTAARVQVAAKWLAGFTASSAAESVQIISVCMAVTGIYDAASGMLLHSLASSGPMPLAQMAQDAFALPCLIDSGSNFCAVALKQHHPEEDDFIYLYLAESVNAGIFSQGALLRGHSHHAARVAHLPLGDPAVKCPLPGCSLSSCVLGDLGLSGMLRNFPDTLSGEDSEKWRQAVAALVANPENYRAYLESKADCLGSLLVVLVDLFDPAVVYLGGKCMRIFQQLSPLLRSRLERDCPLACASGLSVVHDEFISQTLYEGMTHSVYNEWRPLSDNPL